MSERDLSAYETEVSPEALAALRQGLSLDAAQQGAASLNVRVLRRLVSGPELDSWQAQAKRRALWFCGGAVLGTLGMGVILFGMTYAKSSETVRLQTLSRPAEKGDSLAMSVRYPKPPPLDKKKALEQYRIAKRAQIRQIIR